MELKERLFALRNLKDYTSEEKKIIAENRYVGIMTEPEYIDFLIRVFAKDFCNCDEIVIPYLDFREVVRQMKSYFYYDRKSGAVFQLELPHLVE